MTNGQPLRTHPRKAILCAVTAALVGASANLLGATTDIADVPLASASNVAVKPNIMYILDDSGSMRRDWMPDEMSKSEKKTSWAYPLCNTVYYNPAVFYPPPPKDASGKKFPNQSFTAAQKDGYNAASEIVDLSIKFKASDGDDEQRAYYYVLIAGTPPASPLSLACTKDEAPDVKKDDPDGTTYPSKSGAWTWKKVLVSATSGPNGSDERQNFANWYGFYRTRMMMMRAATARVFISNLSSSHRVGFITINPRKTGNINDKYLRIADFDSAHKQAFLNKLYVSIHESGMNTPLRESLATVGWMYAGKLDAAPLTSGIPATDDPVQYSCQQNFALITTDGLWNGEPGRDLNGNPVNHQDSDITEKVTAGDPARTVLISPRPMWDGSSTSTVEVTITSRKYKINPCNATESKVFYDETIAKVLRSYSGSQLVSETPISTSISKDKSDSNCAVNPVLPPDSSVETSTSPKIETTSGAINSLADVAMYYYKTDLRPSMPDNVPQTGDGIEDDRAPWQHMTTFSLVTGIYGQLKYTEDYKTNPDPTTDYNKIKAGTLNWPVTADSAADVLEAAKADDVWHTAVNGRGMALVGHDPNAIVSALTSALAGVNAQGGSAAAAATSNLEPVAGDNFAYTASFQTVKWQGELNAREIDLKTGLVIEKDIWSARSKLNAMAYDDCDTRVIHLFRSSAASNLVPFKWDTRDCKADGTPTGPKVTTLDASEQAYFGASAVAALSQWLAMTDGSGGSPDQRSAAAGANLVNYLRGQRGKETFIAGSIDRLYRAREYLLGDIVNAQPLFVRKPFAQYADSGYDAFKSAQASRTPMLYVGANDGMLHAFHAGASASDPQGGTEAWAFIPTMALPSLHVLADGNYGSLHRFFVDGTPVSGDVYDSAASQWKTILVGGLNKGGQGYYALDITDPLNPKGLWELKYSSTCFDPASASTWKADCNLGYSYGNPVISKLSNGTWVVFLTSGYNNVNAAANDGQGFLYVLNAVTGDIIKKIGTGTGAAATPSGLAKIAHWVDDAAADNTTRRVYGVDLLGNLWRFDVNGAAASGSLAQLIATVRDAPLPGGQPQPITTKPELSKVGGRPFVYVATGRYVGASDLGSTQRQTIYAIHDPLSATTPSNTVPLYADLRTSTPPNGLRQMTLTNTVIDGKAARTSTCNAHCSAKDGWLADLPDTKERVNVDMKLQLGTLTVLSNVPSDDACTIGGYSYINFFDYTSGLPVPSNGLAGLRLADSLAVGVNVVRLPAGKTVAIATGSEGKTRTTEVPIASPGLMARRVSWREIGE